MKKPFRIFSFLSLFFLFSLSGYSLPIGEKAPEFSLTDMNGKKISLSGLLGKFVVLEWLNHDCPFIRKHYDSNNMQKLQKEFTEQGIIWLSINSSAPGKQGHLSESTALQITKEKKAFPTTVLLDADGKVGKLYDAKTTPHMFVIDPKGILVYQGAIDDKPSTQTGDIVEAINYVKAALNARMKGQEVAVNSTKPYGCNVKY